VNILHIFPCVFGVVQKVNTTSMRPGRSALVGRVHFRALPIWT